MQIVIEYMLSEECTTTIFLIVASKSFYYSYISIYEQG